MGRKQAFIILRFRGFLLRQHNRTYKSWYALNTHPFELQLPAASMTLGQSLPLWASVSSTEKWERLHLFCRIVIRMECDSAWLLMGHTHILFISLPLPRTRHKELGGKDPKLKEVPVSFRAQSETGCMTSFWVENDIP